MGFVAREAVSFFPHCDIESLSVMLKLTTLFNCSIGDSITACSWGEGRIVSPTKEVIEYLLVTECFL